MWAHKSNGHATQPIQRKRKGSSPVHYFLWFFCCYLCVCLGLLLILEHPEICDTPSFSSNFHSHRKDLGGFLTCDVRCANWWPERPDKRDLNLIRRSQSDVKTLVGFWFLWRIIVLNHICTVGPFFLDSLTMNRHRKKNESTEHDVEALANHNHNQLCQP